MGLTATVAVKIFPEKFNDAIKYAGKTSTSVENKINSKLEYFRDPNTFSNQTHELSKATIYFERGLVVQLTHH